MPDLSLLYLVIFLALLFDFINGFHDTANAIATAVTTRALNPSIAVAMAAILNFAGAMLSTGVAKTIGGDIVMSPSMVDQQVISAALLGAIIWNLATWWWGIPSSSSHALIGGIIGAVTISKGFAGLNWGGIERIVLSLILSPVIAMVSGFFVMLLLLWVFGRLSPSLVNIGFKRIQLLSVGLMSFSHGSNDAQKAMGIITLALLSAGQIESFDVPGWVKFACAAAMGLGTSFGGWKIIKTVGSRITKLEPIHGFASELNGAVVVAIATFLHLPVSTTHVVAGSIMGVGAVKRVSAVRWGVARSMVFAWFITIPFSAMASAAVYVVIKQIGL